MGLTEWIRKREHKINNIFYVSKCLGLLLDVLWEILLKRPFHKPLQTM